ALEDEGVHRWTSAPKERLRLPDCTDEGVHIGGGAVKVERCPGGGGQVQTAHQWLRAVVAGANTDALAVEHRRDVVRMHADECERNDAAPEGNFAWTIQREPVDLTKLRQRELE